MRVSIVFFFIMSLACGLPLGIDLNSALGPGLGCSSVLGSFFESGKIIR